MHEYVLSWDRGMNMVVVYNLNLIKFVIINVTVTVFLIWKRERDHRVTKFRKRPRSSINVRKRR
jgi:hypothetical protein